MQILAEHMLCISRFISCKTLVYLITFLQKIFTLNGTQFAGWKLKLKWQFKSCLHKSTSKHGIGLLTKQPFFLKWLLFVHFVCLLHQIAPCPLTVYYWAKYHFKSTFFSASSPLILLSASSCQDLFLPALNGCLYILWEMLLRRTWDKNKPCLYICVSPKILALLHNDT